MNMWFTIAWVCAALFIGISLLRVILNLLVWWLEKRRRK